MAIDLNQISGHVAQRYLVDIDLAGNCLRNAVLNNVRVQTSSAVLSSTSVTVGGDDVGEIWFYNGRLYYGAEEGKPWVRIATGDIDEELDKIFGALATSINSADGTASYITASYNSTTNIMTLALNVTSSGADIRDKVANRLVDTSAVEAYAQHQIGYSSTAPTKDTEGAEGDVLIVPDNHESRIGTLEKQVLGSSSTGGETLASRVGTIEGNYLNAASGGLEVAADNHTVQHPALGDRTTDTSVGPTAAVTLKHSGKFTVPRLTVDKYGHVSSVSEYTLTLPSSGNTDTKVRQTLTSSNTDLPILMTGVSINVDTENVDTISYRSNSIYANASTGTVTATTFKGALTGDVTGNCSGSSGSCTGNAATATKATQDGEGNVINTTYAKKSDFDEAIAGIRTELSTVYQVKGSLNGTTLPSGDKVAVGDVYNININNADRFELTTDQKNLFVDPPPLGYLMNGTNIVYTAAGWDVMGGVSVTSFRNGYSGNGTPVITVTHNLGTYPNVQVFTATKDEDGNYKPGDRVFTGIEMLDANSLKLRFNSNQLNTAHYYVVCTL